MIPDIPSGRRVKLCRSIGRFRTRSPGRSNRSRRRARLSVCSLRKASMTCEARIRRISHIHRPLLLAVHSSVSCSLLYLSLIGRQLVAVLRLVQQFRTLHLLPATSPPRLLILEPKVALLDPMSRSGLLFHLLHIRLGPAQRRVTSQGILPAQAFLVCPHHLVQSRFRDHGPLSTTEPLLSCVHGSINLLVALNTRKTSDLPVLCIRLHTSLSAVVSRHKGALFVRMRCTYHGHRSTSNIWIPPFRPARRTCLDVALDLHREVPSLRSRLSILLEIRTRGQTARHGLLLVFLLRHRCRPSSIL